MRSVVRKRASAVFVTLALIGLVHAGPSAEVTFARHRALLHEGPSDALAGPDEAAQFTVSAGAAPTHAPRTVAPTIPARAGLRANASRCVSPSPGSSPCGVRATLGLTATSSDEPPAAKASTFDGSSLALALPIGEAYVSVESRHWGPGWAGSLILDGAAAPLPALGWRQPGARAIQSRALAWLGRWTADVFVGALEGHSEPARPWLVGMRATVEPLDGVVFGASRSLQWGGRGRPESLRSLWNGLLGRDNIGAGLDAANEPGNQLAGFDLRVVWPLAPARRLALYGQAIGEDEAGYLPSKYAGLVGADVAWQPFGVDARLFAEWADTVAGSLFGRPVPGTTYRHSIYRQGYTHAGAPLGHPVGGDARLGSVGLIASSGSWSALVVAHRGRAAEQAQRLPPGRTVAGLDAALTVQVDARAVLGLTLWSWRVGTEPRRTSAQATFRWSWR